ncbi:hypothetical protein BJ742DRAFT_890074 [Cladochytrium replicatum]|nr:hypothetical protein BJ742DRAFT_890074 [Cladochytrium replicatum]
MFPRASFVYVTMGIGSRELVGHSGRHFNVPYSAHAAERMLYYASQNPLATMNSVRTNYAQGKIDGVVAARVGRQPCESSHTSKRPMHFLEGIRTRHVELRCCRDCAKHASGPALLPMQMSCAVYGMGVYLRGMDLRRWLDFPLGIQIYFRTAETVTAYILEPFAKNATPYVALNALNNVPYECQYVKELKTTLGTDTILGPLYITNVSED